MKKAPPTKMDWFTWLSRTNLDPSRIYEYALTFTHNELVEDDLAHFSHDFLQSMGVSVAKHRLEILKLARKKKSSRTVLWLMFVFNQTKDYVCKHVQTLVRRDQSSSLSLVPKRNQSLRWKVAMLQRNKRMKTTTLARPEWPVFVSGDEVMVVESRSSDSAWGSSNWVDSEGNGESGRFAMSNGEYWSSSIDEIKWDSMFKNLNPT